MGDAGTEGWPRLGGLGRLLGCCVVSAWLAPRTASADHVAPRRFASHMGYLRAAPLPHTMAQKARWLDASPPLAPLPPPPPDGAIPAMLRGGDVHVAPLGIGSVALGLGSHRLRLDGELRMGAFDRPMLGGRLAFGLDGRHVEIKLPSVQVVTEQRNGVLAVEVGVVLWDRRF